MKEHFTTMCRKEFKKRDAELGLALISSYLNTILSF
uniref:Uncharacterized protein n=1 Tax=Lepeophtheirus salmonis TaxID=72036 RepID=A0A0K2UEN0_LEPSM